MLSDANPDDFAKPGTQLAQASGRARGPARTVRVRGRDIEIAEPFANEVEAAALRLERSLQRVKEIDPSWEPLPSLRSSGPVTDVPAYLRGIRMEAQEAEARITVVERGGVPLGFR